MRTIIFLLQKEFIQIFRNRTMLPIIFVMPLVQLLILAYATTFDLKNINTVVVDHDRSVSSREMIRKFEGSSFYTLRSYADSYQQAEQMVEKGLADLIIEIPPNFEKELNNEKRAEVGLVINAINSSSAGLINAYTSAILKDYNLALVTSHMGRRPVMPIDVTYSYWYNPGLDYKTYMVPGILVLLVTIVGFFLSGMNVVREKETGTIEQLNVTPIRKYQFIAGKLLPFWIIAMFELAFGLLFARLIFDLPIVGSLWLIFGVASVFMLAILGLGLIISTLSDTMQQSMFLTWFFMVVFILMSGFFTAIESMPEWAQAINVINPLAYFIRIIRMVTLKGSGLADIVQPLAALAIFGVITLSLAVWRYRKVA
ncbi:MAG: ABC transporter permease [Bacteroidales bacterium]|jgi:ABC-2 type transport system permease protein|nr:ABC transporter permease [Bacteroidales bacterium]